MALASAPAKADSFRQNTTIAACGKWVFKTEDFGKEKLRNYFEYVPDQGDLRGPFQNLVDNALARLKSNAEFTFFPASGTFVMDMLYPDTLGDPVPNAFPPFPNRNGRLAFGTYTQKNTKKLKLRLNNRGASTPGIEVLETVFADLAANQIQGAEGVVNQIPFVRIDQRNVRFKGRVKHPNRINPNTGNSWARLKIKMKARLEYDHRFMNSSEFADRFGGDGVIKIRFKTRDCDD